MIIGVGIDICEVSRLSTSLARTPGLAGRLFTAGELSVAAGSTRGETLAGRFAAKEALAKALGAPSGLAWTDVEVVRLASGAPSLRLTGSVAIAAAALGVTHTHVSISHDGGLATAIVICEAS